MSTHILNALRRLRHLNITLDLLDLCQRYSRIIFIRSCMLAECGQCGDLDVLAKVPDIRHRNVTYAFRDSCLLSLLGPHRRKH